MTSGPNKVGAKILALLAAKRSRNLDWMIHSSWCSNHDLIIGSIRPPGRKYGVPIVGTLDAVLDRMMEIGGVVLVGEGTTADAPFPGKDPIHDFRGKAPR